MFILIALMFILIAFLAQFVIFAIVKQIIKINYSLNLPNSDFNLPW